MHKRNLEFWIPVLEVLEAVVKDLGFLFQGCFKQLLNSEKILIALNGVVEAP